MLARIPASLCFFFPQFSAEHSFQGWVESKPIFGPLFIWNYILYLKWHVKTQKKGKEKFHNTKKMTTSTQKVVHNSGTFSNPLPPPTTIPPQKPNCLLKHTTPPPQHLPLPSQRHHLHFQGPHYMPKYAWSSRCHHILTSFDCNQVWQSDGDLYPLGVDSHGGSGSCGGGGSSSGGHSWCKRKRGHLLNP